MTGFGAAHFPPNKGPVKPNAPAAIPVRCAQGNIGSRATWPRTRFALSRCEPRTRATGQRFPSQEVIGHARVPTLMPAVLASSHTPAPGRLHWLSNALLGGPFATGARDGAPIQFGCGQPSARNGMPSPRGLRYCIVFPVKSLVRVLSQ